MTKIKQSAKKINHSDLCTALKSISEVVGIEPMLILRKYRDPKIVRARHYVIKFAMTYTDHKLFNIVEFLYPAITHHSTILYGNKKINSDIDLYKEIREEWIEILISIKQKLESDETKNNSDLISRIDSHINRYKNVYFRGSTKISKTIKSERHG